MTDILHKTHSGACGTHWIEHSSGEEIASYNPADGSELGRVRLATAEDCDQVMKHAVRTFERWRMVPAPKRGEIAREIGDALRQSKDELG